MSSNNNNEIISVAKPHTVKKFELIEKYVEGWIPKLLNSGFCDTLVFIDCMCNSGEYRDINGNSVEGTAIRVAKLMRDASWQYPPKMLHIFLNDIDQRKIEHLETLLPTETINFKIHTSAQDANEMLKILGNYIRRMKNTHSLLVYDPYKAEIDWLACMPFFNTWSEVIINHMISDAIRAVPVASKPDTIKKYEQTYQLPFEELLPFGTDRNAYEKQVEKIMSNMRIRKREFYIAAFPFFNRNNSVVYNLIHYTTNPVGFKLFKSSAWHVFGGKSSTKNTHGNENQFVFDFDGNDTRITVADEDCYYIQDIASYLNSYFCGQQNIPLETLWSVLDEHPIFPSDGFRREIKKELRDVHGAMVSGKTISFKK